tara:strand:+ start:968 stop:1291 length:324 start_codon:yes stop_codon:yes gene_type:complete
MIRHVVLLQISGSVDRTECRNVLDAIAKIASNTPGMLSFVGGANMPGSGLNQGFTHCFTIDFVDTKARDDYLDRLDQDETCWRLTDITVGGLGGILSMNLDLGDQKP